MTSAEGGSRRGLDLSLDDFITSQKRDHTHQTPHDNSAWTTHHRKRDRRGYRINVCGLKYSVLREDLMELFSSIGAVMRVTIDYDSIDRSLGTGWVLFESKEDALAAIEKFNGRELDGSAMTLTYQPSRHEMRDRGESSRERFGGGGGGGGEEFISGDDYRKRGGGGGGGDYRRNDRYYAPPPRACYSRSYDRSMPYDDRSPPRRGGSRYSEENKCGGYEPEHLGRSSREYGGSGGPAWSAVDARERSPPRGGGDFRGGEPRRWEGGGASRVGNNQPAYRGGAADVRRGYHDGRGGYSNEDPSPERDFSQRDRGAPDYPKPTSRYADDRPPRGGDRYSLSDPRSPR